MRSQLSTVALAFLLSVSGASGSWAAPIPQYIRAAIASPGRPVDDLAQDRARDPSDAISFSLVKPGDSVAELVPDGGYYTRMLSVVVGSKGHVISVVPLAPGFAAAQRKAAQGKSLPVDAMLALQNMTAYANLEVLWESLSASGGQFALPVQVDVVWSANAGVTLKEKQYGLSDMSQLDSAIFRAIKPGGVYAIQDSERALTSAKPMALRAGFVLDGERRTGTEAVLRFRKPINAPRDKRVPRNFLKGWFGNTALYSPGTDRARPHLYHANGTYDEFGKDDQQGGIWFADAEGNICQVHQYPANARGFTDCHTLTRHVVGDRWTQRAGRRVVPIVMLKGFVTRWNASAGRRDRN